MWLCWVWVWGYERSMGGNISFNWWLAFLYHLARERGFYIYPTINHDDGKTQQYTTYWILQFMWDCGYRIYADQWVKRLFGVNSKWLGKRGTNNTKTGMEIKRTLLQCSTIHLRQRDIEVEDKLWRFVYFIHMCSCVDDFIGCRWAVEHRTKVGLDEKMYEMHSLLLSSNISIFILYLDTLSYQKLSIYTMHYDNENQPHQTG